jgi:hypothetical protein
MAPHSSKLNSGAKSDMHLAFFQRHAGPQAARAVDRTAVDRDAGEVRCGGEWPLHQSRAAQDLAELDIDLAAIMQAAGWKSTRMPLQYAEEINAAGSGMAGGQKRAGGICHKPILNFRQLQRVCFSECRGDLKSRRRRT